jgi:hypothetical protein
MYMDINTIMKVLSDKRPLFHSEADFQFALAWEIKNRYPQAEIRLEAPFNGTVVGRIDILVRHQAGVYPIELKYLKKHLQCAVDNERYDLAEGVHDLDMHDCIKDIARLETFRKQLAEFRSGFAVWLTNDTAYWKASYNASYYSEFHAPQGSVKAGIMKYQNGAKLLRNPAYSAPIELNGQYRIAWEKFSSVGTAKHGEFKYAVVRVD